MTVTPSTSPTPFPDHLMPPRHRTALLSQLDTWAVPGMSPSTTRQRELSTRLKELNAQQGQRDAAVITSTCQALDMAGTGTGVTRIINTLGMGLQDMQGWWTNRVLKGRLNRAEREALRAVGFDL